MAMAIVEVPRPVTGGVDTHVDTHVAAVVDPLGGVVGIEAFETTEAGYQRAWSAGSARMAGSSESGSRAPAPMAPA